MKNNELIIVIPAYEPNKLMLDLLYDLNQNFSDFSIIIVNDGSKTADETFKQALKYDNVTILNHLVNKGKGAALKTAFKYIESLDYKDKIIVTADADGQHRPKDIFKVASYYKKVKNGVVLGSRQFDGKVPLRSRFGNDATKFLYRMFNNKKLHDNQTGLRAFGCDLIPFMLSIEGDRYEYEMNMLMECAKKGVDINEVKIETVYINNNESSHFNPIKDFLKICKNIVKYAVPAILTILADILVFIQVFLILKNVNVDVKTNILISSFVGCLTSYFVYLIISLNGVFHGNKSIFNTKKRKLKYIFLGGLAVLSNTITVSLFYVLFEKVGLAKTLTETAFIVVFLLTNYLFVPKVKLN